MNRIRKCWNIRRMWLKNMLMNKLCILLLKLRLNFGVIRISISTYAHPNCLCLCREMCKISCIPPSTRKFKLSTIFWEMRLMGSWMGGRRMAQSVQTSTFPKKKNSGGTLLGKFLMKWMRKLCRTLCILAVFGETLKK